MTDRTVKLTIKIWLPSGKDEKISETVKVLGGKSTPHLDAKLFFNKKEKLRTRVHFKEGYKIKYVVQHSIHTDTCKKSVIKSQSIWTTELTMSTPGNENLSLSVLCPKINTVMREAELLKEGEILPKLGHVLDTRMKDMKLADKKKENEGQLCYLCASKICRKLAENFSLYKHENRLSKQHKILFRF